MPNPDPKDHPLPLDYETPKPAGNELARGFLIAIGSLCILAAVPFLIMCGLLAIDVMTEEIPSPDRSDQVGFAVVWFLTSVAFTYLGYRLVSHALDE
jgi:hypothetical protein